MKIISIAAMSLNRVIGRDGALPWRLQEDMRRFKAHTEHNAVIMGRKTFESLQYPLPNRLNIVLSKGTPTYVRGIITASDLQNAINFAYLKGHKKAFIIGGASVYRDAMPLCDEALITVVEASIEGDTYFDADMSKMVLVSSELFTKDSQNDYDMVFQKWTRT